MIFPMIIKNYFEIEKKFKTIYLIYIKIIIVFFIKIKFKFKI